MYVRSLNILVDVWVRCTSTYVYCPSAINLLLLTTRAT